MEENGDQNIGENVNTGDNKVSNSIIVLFVVLVVAIAGASYFFLFSGNINNNEDSKSPKGEVNFTQASKVDQLANDSGKEIQIPDKLILGEIIGENIELLNFRDVKKVSFVEFRTTMDLNDIIKSYTKFFSEESWEMVENRYLEKELSAPDFETYLIVAKSTGKGGLQANIEISVSQKDSSKSVNIVYGTF